MYVTEVLNGRPYQCFIPNPLFPLVEASYIKQFSALDRALKTTVDVEAFPSRAAATIAQAGHKHDPGQRHATAAQTLQTWLPRDWLGVAQLKKINAQLSDGDEGFRQGPVWMGAPHPSLSWHVGSPPSRLNGLMKTLVDLPQSRQPASLQSLLGLLRLLQIHPFQDGNGRTARCYAIWLGYRQLGSATGLLDLLDALCERARCDLNAISLEVQNTNRFDTVFDRFLALHETRC